MIQAFKEYSISLLFIPFLFLSCKESPNRSDIEEKKVLLSNLLIPNDYKVVAKYHSCPEGESCGYNDSTYILEKEKSSFKIRVKYFDKNLSDTDKVNINDRIKSIYEEAIFERPSLEIRNKKVNNDKSIWYINDASGSKGNLFYTLHMERITPTYWIIIYIHDSQLSLDEIEFLYNELGKFEDKSSIGKKNN